jgi:ATP-dependent DNA ligase
VANERGAPDFDALLAAIGKEPSRLAFVAFDILHLDGRNLRPLPLIERKQLLWQLVEPGVGRMQFSEHFEGDALAIFRAVERLGLEGIVSKQADSRYRSGPSKTWLKAKYFDEADFELLGVLREPGEAPMALMATHDAERRYVGSAIIALNRGDARQALEAGRDEDWAVTEGSEEARCALDQAGISRTRPLSEG